MKTLRPWIAATVIIGSILTLSVIAAESPSVLLQKGIFAEETEGNVDAAIKIYLQIAAEAAANRSVVAQAQYRLAMCYQKKGNKEQAIAALNDLLKQFPADAALAQKARDVLSGLGQVSSTEARIRKIPLDGSAISVSPDGRFISYRPRAATRSVAIYETATGKTWTVAKEQKNGVETMIFSTDGRRIAYESAGSVFVAATDGSDPKQVYKKKSSEDWTWLSAWTPDDRQLLTLCGDSKRSGVGFLELKTGIIKEIKSGPPGQLGGWHLSSNGRYIVMRFGRKGTREQRFSILDLESARMEPLAERDIVRIVGWSRGDEKLLFTSDRSGANDLWAIAVRDGKPAGEPELVRKNWVNEGLQANTRMQNVTRDGNIYYSEERHSAYIYLTTVDLQTGEILGQPRRLTDRYPGVQTQPIWSKDGQSILFAVGREKMKFVSLATTSGALREYPEAQDLTNGITHYSRTQNDDFLIVDSWKKDGSIHRYELASGRTETLANTRDLWSHELSPDGDTLYYFGREPVKNADNSVEYKYHIGKRNLRSGKDEVVYAPVYSWARMKLSPDGQKLAVNTRPTKGTIPGNVITIVSLRGGEAKEFVQATRVWIDSIAWTPDGRRVVYTTGGYVDSPARNISEIWAMPVDSGKAVRIDFSRPNITDIAVHPDGRQIAFRAGALKDGEDLWVMEGFLNRKTADPISWRLTDFIGREIAGPNQSILDRKYGLALTYPDRWTIFGAGRHSGTGDNQIQFSVPEIPGSLVVLNYYALTPGEFHPAAVFGWANALGPKPTTSAEVDAWLRRYAQGMARHRINASLHDYQVRPASIALRTVGGHRAVSALADYTKSAEQWTESLTCVYGDTVIALFRAHVPTARLNAIRLPLDMMIETLRLQEAIPDSTAGRGTAGTKIPLDQIPGQDRSILDRKFGLAATLPADWSLHGSLTDGLASLIRINVPGSTDILPQRIGSSVQLNYWAGVPGEIPAESPESWANAMGPRPATPAEVEAWLRRYPQFFSDSGFALNYGWTAEKLVPANIVVRTLGGNRTVTWTADFTSENQPWTLLYTVILGESATARVTAWAPTAKIDGFRPGCDALITSVRLP